MCINVDGKIRMCRWNLSKFTVAQRVNNVFPLPSSPIQQQH